MTLPRDEVTSGILAELEDFEDLVRSVDEQDWASPTRCEGWTVADVAAHVVGSQTDIVDGRLDGLGTPEVTRRQVVERSGRTPAELADELAAARKASVDLLALFDDATWAGPAPGGYEGTLGDGVEAIWYDAFLHADDIRAAIGRPSVPGPGLRASLSHLATILTQQGWGDATLALDGQARFDVGAGGDPIGGDPLAFVQAATGRADPAAFGLDERVNVYR